MSAILGCIFSHSRSIYLKNFRIYLGVRTCELFLCFVAIVRVKVIMLTSLFSLFYVTREFHRFLHRGRAKFSGGACPRTPLGRLRLRLALKMPSQFYLAPPIAKMLRGPCREGVFFIWEFPHRYI